MRTLIKYLLVTLWQEVLLQEGVPPCQVRHRVQVTSPRVELLRQHRERRSDLFGAASADRWVAAFTDQYPDEEEQLALLKAELRGQRTDIYCPN